MSSCDLKANNDVIKPSHSATLRGIYMHVLGLTEARHAAKMLSVCGAYLAYHFSRR